MRIKNSIKSLMKTLHGHKKLEPDIFIFTLPRAGSTLLAEILNTDPNLKMASESFALNNDNTQVLIEYFDKGFLTDRYVDISEINLEKIFRYYGDLSEGKTWNSYYWSDLLTPYHSLSTTRTIFKTQKVTYYFDDLMCHFKGDFGLYLLRHPVSHSLSRLRNGWSTYIKLYAESEKIKEILTHEAKIKIDEVNDAGSDLEKFIVSWCLENYIFIYHYQNESLPSNIIPVFYEDLVVHSEDTIKEICNKVKLEYNENMLSIVGDVSSGIVHSTEETKYQITAGNKNYLINRWKEKMDRNDEKQYKDILTSFGINLYLE